MNSDKSLLKFSGTLAILAAICFVLSGIGFLLDPAPQTTTSSAYYAAILANPTPGLLFHWSLALAALLTVPVIFTVSRLVRSTHEGWVLWATYLACLGLTITAISDLRAARLKVLQATTYVEGSAAVQAAVVESVRSASLDPELWYSFGGLGVWFLAVNALALQSNAWPRRLAYLGILSGILNWAIVIGLVFGLKIVNQIAAGLGGVVVLPLWLFLMGRWLRQRAADSG